MPNFNVSNVFEYERNKPDVSYEKAYMATEGNENFTDILYHLNWYQDRCGHKFSSKKLKEAVLRVMEQEKEEIEHNINNITSDTSFESHPFSYLTISSWMPAASRLYNDQFAFSFVH